MWSDAPLGTNEETGENYCTERLKNVTRVRTDRFREKFEMNNAWMKGMESGEVARIKGDFKRWVDEGVVPGEEPVVVEEVGDAEMED